MSAQTRKRGPLTPTSFHILLALVEGPLHGYGIQRRLHAAGLQTGPGAIYGALSRMEQGGWVAEAGAERARGPSGQRYRFALTPEGLEVLKADARRVTSAADLIRSYALLDRDQA